MIDRKARAWIGALAMMLIVSLIAATPAARGEYNNISSIDLATMFTAESISASGTATSKAFTGLGKTTTHSVQLRGVGTAPNFKLEALCTLDGTNFVKPETGGDIGTFTDQNDHIAVLQLPLCVGLKLKATELGGANSVAVDAIVRVQ